MLLSLLEWQQHGCDGNGKDHVWLELNQLFGKNGPSILVATRSPINNIKVLIFFVTEFSPIHIGEDQSGALCTAGLRPTSCRRWVKLRRAQCELMLSALPSNADIHHGGRQVADGPIFGLMRRNTSDLLDHLVGATEHRKWHCDAECLSCLEINDQLDLR